jgi:hypothetical protein
MRDATIRRVAVDAAAFDAALRRVVERVVAAPADDSAGARVVARLTAPAAWRPGLVAMLAAPAAVAVAVLLLFVAAPDPRFGPSSDDAPAAAAAPTEAVRTAPANAASPEPRGADRPMIAGAAPALASSGRRRSRPRVAAVAAPRDGDPVTEPAMTSGSTADARVGWYELTLPPDPLPVDRLEIVAIDAAGPDPRQHE